MPDVGALPLFLLIVWLLVTAGRQVSGWVRLPTNATGLERALIGLAFGLGLLSYLMLALGLCGFLTRGGALLALAVLLVLGVRQWRPLALELRAWRRTRRSLSLPEWGFAALFAVFALVSLIGILTPPTLIEWDSLAYHLADPKIYLQAHRIYYLPWESHSNFAFTTEMWYTLGLLLEGVPLAKCFHFACGMGACLTVFAFGRRFLTPRIGLWAALLFASTPLVFWEAGTAYADLAATFFTTLTLLTLALAFQTMTDNPLDGKARGWLWCSAILMGLTLSTKATALSTLGLLALGLLFACLRRAHLGWGRGITMAATWVALALLVGSPWYLKSTAYTGNPVYPFYFQLFGGRNWNAGNAAAYDASNADFGMGRAPDKLLLVPWNLTMFLAPGHPLPPRIPASLTDKQSFNDHQSILMLLSPVLLAALFFPAFGRAAPGVVRVLGVFALGAGILWCATAQHVRYLLPVLPVLCLLTSWVLSETLSARWRSGYTLGVLAVISLAGSLWVGGQLMTAQGPVALGLVSRDAYIASGEPAYPAMQFINTQLPPQAKLVFYGNPLGFYCDRPYIWGESGHSAFIPYGTFHTADDLNRWLTAHGFTHVLINERSFSLGSGSGWPGWVAQLTEGHGPPVFSQNGVQVYALPPGR